MLTSLRSRPRTFLPCARSSPAAVVSAGRGFSTDPVEVLYPKQPCPVRSCVVRYVRLPYARFIQRFSIGNIALTIRLPLALSSLGIRAAHSRIVRSFNFRVRRFTLETNGIVPVFLSRALCSNARLRSMTVRSRGGEPASTSAATVDIVRYPRMHHV